MIRPITTNDFDAVVDTATGTGMFKPIETASLRKTLEEIDVDEYAVVAEENGVILAFAYYEFHHMTVGAWHLRWFVVRQDQQRHGVGSELLAYMETHIRSHHGGVIFVDTGSPPAYDGARRFYAKHGYEQHAVVQDYWADGDSLVVFRKKL